MSLDVTDPSTSPQGGLTDGKDTSTAATGGPCSHPAEVRHRTGPGSGLQLFSPTGSRGWPGPGALLLEAAGPHTGEQAAGVRSAGGHAVGQADPLRALPRPRFPSRALMRVMRQSHTASSSVSSGGRQALEREGDQDPEPNEEGVRGEARKPGRGWEGSGAHAQTGQRPRSHCPANRAGGSRGTDALGHPLMYCPPSTFTKHLLRARHGAATPAVLSQLTLP